MNIILIITGIVLILFIYIIWIMKYKCNTIIEAVYVKSNVYKAPTGGYGLVTKYAPIFKYKINNVNYKQQSFQAISKIKNKNYIKGNKYNIYINDKNPKIFILSKKIKIVEILILLIGMFFIIMGILI